MQRILEPELMDESEQALAYASADFSEPNQRFVESFVAEFPGLSRGAVLDLGCGDGRILFIAAQKFQAKAVGVELSSRLVKATEAKARSMGLGGQIKVIEGNLLGVDLGPADVVTIYLMRLANERLKPNLLKQLKPGARVVSHDYEIMGWKPSAVESIKVHRREHIIYVYRMPPETN